MNYAIIITSTWMILGFFLGIMYLFVYYSGPKELIRRNVIRYPRSKNVLKNTKIVRIIYYYVNVRDNKSFTRFGFLLLGISMLLPFVPIMLIKFDESLKKTH